MKKAVKKILLIFIIILLIQCITHIFKSNHKITYKINSNNKVFSINEIYKNNNYYFNISVDDYSFIFDYKNIFSKQKKVINGFEYFETTDMSCLYPILKGNNYYDIICSDKKNIYYYNYLNKDVNDFVENLKEKGYISSSWDDETYSKKVGGSLIYQNNILPKTYIYVWKYNGFYSLNQRELKQLNILKNDTYLNNLGIKVDKYYLIPNYDDDYEYNSLYIFNMTNNKMKKLEFKESISKDYYVNGIIKNKLYIFDIDNLIQYKINPKRNNYEIVGDKDTGGLYYDSKWETLDIYDFKKEKLIFKNDNIPKKLDKYEVIGSYKSNYYYIDDENFMIYNEILNTSVYALKVNDINDIKFVKDDLYFIQDNILYCYNVNNGLKKIMEYDELSFNKVNRYDVYKK